MSPVVGAESSGRVAGKTISPGLVAVFSLITIGIYALFFWWRVSKETDGLRGHRHAHGIMRTGIILGFVGAVVALVVGIAAVATVVAATYTADNASTPTEQQIFTDLLKAALPLLVVFALAILVACAGQIISYVGMYRSWDSLKRAEQGLGRPDPVNPALYLWLPLGCGLLGYVPFIGVLFSLASLVLWITFMALTQSHLNALWARGVQVAPPPAPVAL